MAGKRNAMGRGLNMLISDQATVEKAVNPAAKKALEAAGGVKEVAIDEIVTSPWQPRHHFEQEALAELTASIQEHGVLQPLLVRKVNGELELLAGERRLRASKEAKLKKVPVVVLEADDETALEIALIENLQREDLDPIEEAEGYAPFAEGV